MYLGRAQAEQILKQKLRFHFLSREKKITLREINLFYCVRTGAISNKLRDWGIQQQWDTELFPTSSYLHINLSHIAKIMVNLKTKFPRSCVDILSYVRTDSSKANLVATDSGFIHSTKILYFRYLKYNPIWKLKFWI